MDQRLYQTPFTKADTQIANKPAEGGSTPQTIQALKPHEGLLNVLKWPNPQHEQLCKTVEWWGHAGISSIAHGDVGEHCHIGRQLGKSLYKLNRLNFFNLFIN